MSGKQQFSVVLFGSKNGIWAAIVGLYQWFLTSCSWLHTHFENEKLATRLEYPNYNQATVLWKQVPNYLPKVKVRNNLAKHRNKLKTQFVAIPWVENHRFISSSYILPYSFETTAHKYHLMNNRQNRRPEGNHIKKISP